MTKLWLMVLFPDTFYDFRAGPSILDPIPGLRVSSNDNKLYFQRAVTTSQALRPADGALLASMR